MKQALWLCGAYVLIAIETIWLTFVWAWLVWGWV